MQSLMGTDISCWAERRVSGVWEFCYTGETAPDGRPYPLEFYCGEERNYALFAILADVRRMTNHGFEPIAPPRGLPADSPIFRGHPGDQAEQETPECHNATWLTLRELEAFPWHEKRRTGTGYVDMEQYRVYRERGMPERAVLYGSTCDPPSSGPGRLVSNEEMDRLVSKGRTEDVLTLVSWTDATYADYAGPFVTETLPLLRAQGEPDDVRIVMSFDS